MGEDEVGGQYVDDGEDGGGVYGGGVYGGGLEVVGGQSVEEEELLPGIDEDGGGVCECV